MAPLGPPQRPSGAGRATLLVVLGAALLLTSALGGYEVALRDSDRLEIVLWFLPAIAAMLAMTSVWQDFVWAPRCDGRVLEGTGVLGRQGVDLARLTAVAAAANARAHQLLLRDDVGAISLDPRGLAKAGPAVHDAVGRAVWAGQEQGRYLVPGRVAAVWGMPVRPGAPRAGRTGVVPKTAVVVGLLVAGLAVGAALGLR
ncbi:hypothetical protein [Klenkia sp. PcliD-1-E]|uniref:hypothetical protein n=1 Tax=Klenkia sp. PcliD-1-E TaxID=2954492 RepID=UPI0020974407|nr:hypothetical protein [Klenkia sp. PcliD-1-E]MCO7222297.1 hypothetical protein [Klenkia sp. PcliD-1-E]